MRLLVGGVAIDTIAASIGDIGEDNTVNVVLEITDPAFVGGGAVENADVPPEEQDWTPHPFRDAWRTAHKYVGPIIALLQKIGRSTFHHTVRVAAPILSRIKSRVFRRLSA